MAVWQIVILVGMLLCAVMAVRTQRLLISALWLAGASALVALWMYLLGAPEIAVIELSVGAGLVTVLFVFAINISGEGGTPAREILPRPVSWGLVILSIGLLGWFCLSAAFPALSTPDGVLFKIDFWQNRAPDVLLQIVIIFAGALGILGLLAEGKTNSSKGEE
ncbi:MAG TPA: NADH-quinone oxidoreductase subunit J [Leptolinea sp.]